MTIKILGIDYSLSGTGLAGITDSKLDFYKVFTSKKQIIKDYPEHATLAYHDGTQEERIDSTCKDIIECGYDYNFVCMEEHTGVNYSWMDGYAIIKYLLRQKGIPYITISPTSLKKYAGAGRADKDAMTRMLQEEYGYDFSELEKSANNVVDATWLALVGKAYYRRYVLGENTKPVKCRHEVLLRLKKNNKYFEEVYGTTAEG